ncbi:MAG: signal peptidase I [Clostridia bacterium]|nr:signal peptidase I [Clostridia bacterium]
MANKTTNKTKYIFEKTLDVFAWLCLAFAIILSLITVFASFSGESNGKEIFGYKMLIVNTNSMSKSPTSQDESVFFDAGDVIVIAKIGSPKDLKVGEVITFFSYNPESMGKTVSHKIREIKYSSDGEVSGIVTYGINKGVNDIVEVKPEHLIGRYAFKLPRIGHLFSFLQTPRGFYLSILIPGVLLIIFFSVKVGKILGKQEYAKLYNGEVDFLKSTIANLEKKGGALLMEEKTTQNSEQINEQQIEQPTEQTAGQPLQGQTQAQPQAQGQVAPTIYQSVSITYYPTPFTPQPIICQTAPGNTTPVHQSINLAPLGTAQQAPCYYQPFPYQPQPVIYQTIGGNNQAPTQNIYQGGQPPMTNPGIYQTVGTPTVMPAGAPTGTPTVSPTVMPIPVYYQPIYYQPQPAPQQTATQENTANEKPVPAPTPSTDETAVTKVDEEDNNQNDNKFNIPDVPKKPFAEKILESKKQTQSYFNDLHNQLTSYKKVTSRISLRCASYRKGRTLLAKISLRGKTLTGYFNLDVKDFNENVYFQKDVSATKAYEEVPFAVKIKSDRACNNAGKLITALAEKFELIKNEKFEPTNQIKELKKLKKGK